MKNFLIIHKFYVVLFIFLGLVMVFNICLIGNMVFKMYKILNEETTNINTNNWVKERYYGTNGKRYSFDE